jgi:molybdate transport system substrate-binding protein
VLLVFFVTLFSACRASSVQTEHSELTVAAAADLADAFQEIAREFQTMSGTKVTFSFGSSGLLTRQIENGAPMDIMAAANVDYINQLEAKGLILPDTKAVYARGRITLWLPKDSNLQVDRIEDLTRPEVKRVAIANPEHAPYGKAAREAFEKTGIWERVRTKLVYGENIRQTMQFAETGNADVAIVALSLSQQSNGRWVLVPEELHAPLDQALAVIKETKNEKVAREFALFITGARGREVLARFGFTFPVGQVAH